MGMFAYKLIRQDKILENYESKIIDYTVYNYNDLRGLCKEKGIKTDATPKMKEMIGLLEATNKEPIKRYIDKLTELGRREQANKVKKEFKHLLETTSKGKTTEKE